MAHAASSIKGRKRKTAKRFFDITLTTPIVIDDHHGGTVVQDVTIRIIGANDDPQATPDSNGLARGAALMVSAAKGVLANDSDPDIHDHLVVDAVNGTAANVGHSTKGTYGSLTLNSDGSYIYTANKGSLPSQMVAQDKFSYTVSDGHGGTDTSTLTIVVSDPDTRYRSGEHTILIGGNGKDVLDGAAGTGRSQAAEKCRESEEKACFRAEAR